MSVEQRTTRVLYNLEAIKLQPKGIIKNGLELLAKLILTSSWLSWKVVSGWAHKNDHYVVSKHEFCSIVNENPWVAAQGKHKNPGKAFCADELYPQL